MVEKIRKRVAKLDPRKRLFRVNLNQFRLLDRRNKNEIIPKLKTDEKCLGRKEKEPLRM